MITENAEHGSSGGPRAEERWAEVERRLVSAGLADYVERLGPDERDPTEPLPAVQAVFGPHFNAMLENGLAGVPGEVLDRLLKNPSLLIALKVTVLAAGGPYWTSRIDLAAESLPARAKRFLKDVGREYQEKLRDEGDS